MRDDSSVIADGNKLRIIVKTIVGRAPYVCMSLTAAVLLVFFATHAPGSQENLEDLSYLIDHVHSRQSANSLEFEMLIAAEKSFSERSTLWPIKTFLISEIRRLRGEAREAVKGYRKLSEWGATDPYRDGRGGSGLCVIALWRWLTALNRFEKPEPDIVLHALEIAEKILDLRLSHRMIGSGESPLLESIPAIREGISRILASIAWKAGTTNLRKEALGLFFDYMAITTSWEFNEQEMRMRNALIQDGIATPDRLTLFLGQRLMVLKRYDEAEKHLITAYESDNYQVTAEAGLSLAQLYYKRRKPVASIIEILDRVIIISEDRNAALIPDALKMRALAYNRLGRSRDIDKFRDDLTRLVSDYPESPLVNLALYLLAKSYQDENRLDRALSYYVQLQDHQGPSDYRKDTSFYQPALIYFSRGTPEDIDQAIAVLEKLERERPKGELHIRALFWLGRFHEERGRPALADNYFYKVLKESPYSYFGLRSRMHLKLGRSAKKQLFPNDEILKTIGKEYRESKEIEKSAASGSDRISPYRLRTKHGINGKLYQKSLDVVTAVRKAFPGKRIEDIPVDQLDESGFLTQLSLLFSLRQDVLAAIDAEPIPEKLKISYMVSREIEDMPVSLSYLKDATYLYSPVKTEVQNNKRFLATAYPAVYTEPILRYGKTYRVNPSLLYAVMRQESLFYPAALSSSLAFGLFQFVPDTFKRLGRELAECKAHQNTSAASMEEFLIDPGNSICLGAAAISRALGERRISGDVFLAILDHIAGARAVKAAQLVWEKQGKRFKDDYEFKIETAPYISMQMYARKVLTDMTLVEAAKIYQ